MAREAQVISGLRSPDKTPERMGMTTTDGRELRPSAKDNARNALGSLPKMVGAPDPKRKLRRFYAPKNANMMILVEAFKDRVGVDGTVERGTSNVARFKDGYLETSDPKTIAKIMACSDYRGTGDAGIIDLDEDNFRRGVDAKDAFVAEVKRNPELLAALKQDLSEDFDLAPAGKATPEPTQDPQPTA